MEVTYSSFVSCARAGLFLLLLSGVAGCTTAPYRTGTPKVSFIGTETLKTYGSELFLECTEPEAKEMQERKLQRNGMDRALYRTDKANRDQPAYLHIPSVFNMPLESFTRMEEQGHTGPPSLVMQLRKREKVLRAKVYHVATTMYTEGNKAVRKESETERYPCYYDWNWHPECETEPKRPIRVQIGALETKGGLPYMASGMLDEEGSIQVDLLPLLEFGASSSSGLGLLFNCPDEGLTAEVRIPQEVFTYYLSQYAGGTP